MSSALGTSSAYTVEGNQLNVEDIGMDVTGNITVSNTVFTSNLYSNNEGNLNMKDNVDFEGNITLQSGKHVTGNLNVNGLVLSQNDHITISYSATITNFAGTRVSPQFHLPGFSPYILTPFACKVYGYQLHAGPESESYTGNIDVELYSSDSTTAFHTESIENTDSRWVTSSTWLDGSTSQFGRVGSILFETPVEFDSDTTMQVVFDSSNSFTGTGIDMTIKLLLKTCF